MYIEKIYKNPFKLSNLSVNYNILIFFNLNKWNHHKILVFKFHLIIGVKTTN